MGADDGNADLRELRQPDRMTAARGVFDDMTDDTKSVLIQKGTIFG